MPDSYSLSQVLANVVAEIWEDFLKALYSQEQMCTICSNYGVQSVKTIMESLEGDYTVSLAENWF